MTQKLGFLEVKLSVVDQPGEVIEPGVILASHETLQNRATRVGNAVKFEVEEAVHCNRALSGFDGPGFVTRERLQDVNGVALIEVAVLISAAAEDKLAIVL